MLKKRILANVAGTVRSPVASQPLLSSTSTAWEGFALEQHYTPPLIEFPKSIKFSGHLIALNASEEPPLMFYRLQGNGERSVRIPDGSLSIVSSQEMMACRQHGASMVFPLLLEDSTMQRVCEEAPGCRQVELIPCAAVEDRTLRNLMSALVDDLRAGCPAGRIFGESLANAIAAYAASKYAVFVSKFPDHRDGLSGPRFRNVIEYIHVNLHSDLSVSEIARVALISPYHFGKLFKQSTGQTLHQYVLDQRIKRAQSLLAGNSNELVDIASSVGFANQSHFTTVFKNKVGVTPGLYRNQVRTRRSAAKLVCTVVSAKVTHV